MRDVAEVRGGSDSYDFKKNSNPPIDPDHCLSLIGSERTISLELPGKVCKSSIIFQFQFQQARIFIGLYTLPLKSTTVFPRIS